MGRRERDYNPRMTALFKPGEADDFFALGRPDSRAALCAEMSRLAYCEEAKIRSVLSGVRFRVVETEDDRGFFDSDGTQAFLARSDDVAVLAFRGTESDDPTDMITDAKVRPESWEVDGQRQGNVHRGFSEALEHVQGRITSMLQTLGKLPLLLTGHSLGAALATLTASLVKSGTLYMYGSPRVGDAEFCREGMRGVEAHRYVNCCDLVCKVPPESFGYEHCGQLHYIDRDGSVSTTAGETAMEEDQSTARREYLFEYGWRRGNVVIRDLADHAPINYVSAVE